MWRPNAVRPSTKVPIASKKRMSGTTYGIPLRLTRSGLLLRSTLSANTAPPVIIKRLAVLITQSFTSSVFNPARRRVFKRLSPVATYATATTTKNTQLRSGERLLFSTARIVLSSIRIVPPSPARSNNNPWNAKKAARVTTNDGIPIRAMSEPRINPRRPPTTMLIGNAMYHAT